ncbi:actin-binding protein WASF3-like isoform X2 [Ahaetulla prasina]|uniref:actin-binding protein WASF3-like isoform X2 n=1 Tax=Ahaetulla prasina TaxID=499056 RepID=UPI002649A463|nr:actin-binding protein WASF3-like isoform X2 [Ahaetulla prasina]
MASDSTFPNRTKRYQHAISTARQVQTPGLRLICKITSLLAATQKVSLQDINMRKAFKSSTIQNQQVVSRNSIPNPVMEMYQRCDKPPPLNILTPYRRTSRRTQGLRQLPDLRTFRRELKTHLFICAGLD